MAVAAMAYDDEAKVSALLSDLETAPIQELLRATLRMLRRLTRDRAVDADDIRAVLAAGVSRAQIEDALAVSFSFNTIDRLADAFGFLVPEPKASRTGAKFLGWCAATVDHHRSWRVLGKSMSISGQPKRPLGDITPVLHAAERAMKYLCLIYCDEKVSEQIPSEQLAAVASEVLAFDQSLKRHGQLLAHERLQPVSAATTIRIRNGKMSVTDGPFAETKEQLGGFYLIEARDLNDAIRIASQIPPVLRQGCVEVRPVKDLA